MAIIPPATRLAFAVMFAGLLAIPGGAGAEIYKWVDDDGNVHYGDRPAGDADRVEVERSSRPADEGAGASTDRATKRRRLLRAWEEERRAKEKAARAPREAAERREQRCHRARDRLRSYRNAGRLYDLDAEGNRRVLSDAEREQALAKARQAVEHWCDG